MAPISLVDLRRMSEALSALRGGTISNVVMRSDLRQLRLELADGTMAVIRLDEDGGGKGRFEVDVIRPPARPSGQLEVRFESA